MLILHKYDSVNVKECPRGFLFGGVLLVLNVDENVRIASHLQICRLVRVQYPVICLQLSKLSNTV